MTKKRSSEIFGEKMEIFFGKNVIQKSWGPRKKFSSPQTRCQVFATGLKEETSVLLLLDSIKQFI